MPLKVRYFMESIFSPEPGRTYQKTYAIIKDFIFHNLLDWLYELGVEFESTEFTEYIPPEGETSPNPGA